MLHSKELTYSSPPGKGTFEDDLPFPVWWDMLYSYLQGNQWFIV